MTYHDGGIDPPAVDEMDSLSAFDDAAARAFKGPGLGVGVGIGGDGEGSGEEDEDFGEV